MNCLLFNNTSCSLKQTSTIVLFYKHLKGLSFRSHNAKFWFVSYLVANSWRQVFSFIYPVWHLFNHYPTKSGQKTHPYTFSLLKNFQYHQNNKSIKCTCMYVAKDLKYMPNLCLMYTYLWKYEISTAFAFFTALNIILWKNEEKHIID